jgi:hypothetical protein
MQKPLDPAGPTAERLAKTEGAFTLAGRAKSDRRYSLYDDALGRAWMRQKVSDAEYYALRRYAHHWASGGLQGAMQSLDLDRILTFNPSTMSGLAKSEVQVDHRAAYHEARDRIGLRPAFVADAVACFDIRLASVGLMLGYRSAAHGRETAREILADAGYRLGLFWRDFDRR